MSDPIMTAQRLLTHEEVQAVSGAGLMDELNDIKVAYGVVNRVIFAPFSFGYTLGGWVYNNTPIGDHAPTAMALFIASMHGPTWYEDSTLISYIAWYYYDPNGGAGSTS